MSALDTKLHQLMWSGRQYTLGELHRLTGCDKNMSRESFRKRLGERKCLYIKEGEYYRCVAVLLPSPCEIKRKILEFLRWTN